MCLAVPGKLVNIYDDPTHDSALTRTGKVDFGGIYKEVCLAYVPEATVGDYVLVHVGFAISIVDAEEAQQIFEYLKRMDELTELTELAEIPN